MPEAMVGPLVLQHLIYHTTQLPAKGLMGL